MSFILGILIYLLVGVGFMLWMDYEFRRNYQLMKEYIEKHPPELTRGLQNFVKKTDGELLNSMSLWTIFECVLMWPMHLGNWLCL